MHCQEEDTLTRVSTPLPTSVGVKHGVTHSLVISNTAQPLMPCHPARARQLLKAKKAKVIKHYPFTIKLNQPIKNAGNPNTLQPITIKIDPGAKFTGLALVSNKHVLIKLQLNHRFNISKKVTQRSQYRRRRRTANIRCRQARFLNRTRKPGWLPPSMYSIVANTINGVKKLQRLTPITSIAIESCKFNPAKLDNPNIANEEYTKGTLFGYELWEYILERDNHRCSYCDKTNVALTKDHVIPKSKGGSNRVSNLTCACTRCNDKKDNISIMIFLKNDIPRLNKITARLKKPLASAAVMNSIRKPLLNRLAALGLPIETASGAETKFNRSVHNIPKSHANDSICVGTTLVTKNWNQPTVIITATGRGVHARTKSDKYGFPRLKLPRIKQCFGFQTGDIVNTAKGSGRIAIRSSGHFTLNNKISIKHNKCRLIQKADGYNYHTIN
jgi:hypothetical protein